MFECVCWYLVAEHTVYYPDVFTFRAVYNQPVVRVALHDQFRVRQVLRYVLAINVCYVYYPVQHFLLHREGYGTRLEDPSVFETGLNR